MSHTHVNRRYVAHLVNEMALHGHYYSGIDSRTIAQDIVKSEDLHPVFTGKIEDIIVHMMSAGTVTLRSGMLIPVDGVTELREDRRQHHIGRRCNIRSKRQTAARKRNLQTQWSKEHLAAV